MEIKIKPELETAHRKIVLAQQEVDRLFKAGLSKRDERVKYWLEQLDAWTNYANELNQLRSHGHIEITKTVMSSGRFHITATSNGQYIKNISKNNIPLEILEGLSVGSDYSLNNPPCARCKRLGTELHHWAPKELFEDAEQWPQSYLCPDCHSLWHSTITTPFRTLRRREKTNVTKSLEGKSLA